LGSFRKIKRLATKYLRAIISWQSLLCSAHQQQIAKRIIRNFTNKIIIMGSKARCVNFMKGEKLGVKILIRDYLW